jgi:hypothetical protein
MIESTGSIHPARPVRDRGALVLGGILVAVGAVAYALQRAGIDPFTWLGGSGWTLFVILPGLALLGASFVTRSAGIGLSIAGSVVAMVGLLLLYQDQARHYESWSYAWALIAPTSIGVGMLLHGLRFARPELVTVGTRMVAVGLVLLLALGWYFESIFETGRVPFAIGDSWPLVVLVVGIVVMALALLRNGSTARAENL